jgi:hypothetical protein
MTFSMLPILEFPMNETYEVPQRKGDKEVPTLELKPLPQDLKYQFLDDTNKYLVIVNTNFPG